MVAPVLFIMDTSEPADAAAAAAGASAFRVLGNHALIGPPRHVWVPAQFAASCSCHVLLPPCAPCWQVLRSLLPPVPASKHMAPRGVCPAAECKEHIVSADVICMGVRESMYGRIGDDKPAESLLFQSPSSNDEAAL